MLLGSGAAVIFVAGMPVWMILGVLGLLVLAAPVIWSFLYDYQKDRILVFLNPGADQLGAGYQITQSKIALGSGGIFGKGYLQGSQSRLNYLPEKQTDFVFTMIGEEFGYFGALFILGLYIIMVALLLRLALNLNYRLSRLAFGCWDRHHDVPLCLCECRYGDRDDPCCRRAIADDFIWRYCAFDRLYCVWFGD